MPDKLADPVCHPAHYEVYPVQPIEITRYLGFCFGNVVKYVLRAPWKGGVEDCDKALHYLHWERETPQESLCDEVLDEVEEPCLRLEEFLGHTPGDALWCDVSRAQGYFLEHVLDYMLKGDSCIPCASLDLMEKQILRLRRILALRETAGQIYEGMSGRPCAQENGKSASNSHQEE